MDTVPKEKCPALSLGRKRPCSSPGLGRGNCQQSPGLHKPVDWGTWLIRPHPGHWIQLSCALTQHKKDLNKLEWVQWRNPKLLRVWHARAVRKGWPCTSGETSRDEMFSLQPMFTVHIIGLAEGGSPSTHPLHFHVCLVQWWQKLFLFSWVEGYLLVIQLITSCEDHKKFIFD